MWLLTTVSLTLQAILTHVHLSAAYPAGNFTYIDCSLWPGAIFKYCLGKRL